MRVSPNKTSSGLLLVLLSLPMLPAFFTVVGRGDVESMGYFGGCLLAFFAAAYFVRLGVNKQRVVSVSRYRRIWTSGYVGIGALLAATACFVCQYFLAKHTFSMSCMVSLSALVGTWLAYGAVGKEVQLQGASGYSADEIADELASAEDQLVVINSIATKLEPSGIQQRLKRIVRRSQNVLAQIEADPADLRRARKFLSVFLPGTREVCETYWKIHQSGSTERFERRFRSTLAGVEALVEQQIQKLKDNEEFDLDVQMDVLRQRIKEDL